MRILNSRFRSTLMDKHLNCCTRMDMTQIPHLILLGDSTMKEVSESSLILLSRNVIGM
jgi:hypothetical protein